LWPGAREKNEFMNEPLISVVLCTYNGAKYLTEQIESLLQQTYPNFEVIIADDGSTDGTRNLLLQWKDHPKFFIHFNETNLGYTRNFEKVASLAKGEFISFCDQDDIWMPHKLQRLYESINGYSLVFSDSILIDEDGNDLGKKLSEVRRLESIFDIRTLLFMNIVSGHTMLVRKEIIEKSLPIPERRYHDWWIALVAASHDGAYYLDEPLTYYRQHESMQTVNIVKKRDLKARTHSKRYSDYLNDLEWFELVLGISNEKDRPYIERFYQLYQERKKGNYVWPLFAEFLKQREIIFRYSKKKYWSQIFELRKMARGERSK
jgi:glycosyltransferase involved in cell wall biosynthesis